MAKVKYYAKENTKVGTHSFYAVPVLALQASKDDYLMIYSNLNASVKDTKDKKTGEVTAVAVSREITKGEL